MKYPVALTVNGRAYEREVEARLLLAHFLREELGLTGVHLGCDTASCGACTVILNGRTLKSCARLAVQADGSTIVTIEGLASAGALHPIQACFQEHHAVQCGFCTPGMVLAAKAILDDNPAPTDREVRRGLEGNLCRCTGYHNVVGAVKGAAGRPGGAAG